MALEGHGVAFLPSSTVKKELHARRLVPAAPQRSGNGSAWEVTMEVVAYLGVIQLGVAYTFFTAGMARGVRSLDAGIICYVEPVLNPVWVFLVLGERPSRWALLGGAIIIAAVITHMLLDARSKRRAHAAAFEAAHG
jgi:drug/metabolite transporter (DMT)-like permease